MGSWKARLLALLAVGAMLAAVASPAVADDFDFDGFDDETGFIIIFVDEDFDGIEDFFDAFVDADFDGFDDRFFFFDGFEFEDNPCIGPDAFEDVFGECSDAFLFE